MSNLKSKKIIAGLLCLLLCASGIFAAKKDTKAKSAPMPNWVTTPSDDYPYSKYFTSVGYDRNRDMAELKACEGIASIFSQSVKSSTKASSRMVQAESEGHVSTAKVSSLNQDILRDVDAADLIAVEIKGAWKDENEGVWYTIAVLDKAKAQDIYTQMIKQNVEHIETLLGYETTDQYSFEVFAIYDFCQEIAAMNEGYLERLRVINTGAADSLKPLCQSSKELKLKALDIAKQIPIATVVEGDVDGRVRAAFASAITKAGFRSSTNPNERYVLTVKVVWTPSKTTDGSSVRCDYSISGGLKDNGIDEELMPVSIKGRGSDVDQARAQQKALGNIEKKDVGSKFSSDFDKYLKSITVD